MIKATTKFFRNSKVIYKLIDNKIIILDQNNSKIRELNETAVIIWENSKKPTTAKKICKMLIDEYDIEKDSALIDTVKFVKLYLSEGLFLLA